MLARGIALEEPRKSQGQGMRLPHDEDVHRLVSFSPAGWRRRVKGLFSLHGYP